MNQTLRSSFFHWILVSAPLLAILTAMFFHFESHEHVAAFFRIHRAAHPGLKWFMDVCSDWGNVIFYVAYGILLIKAWRTGDKKTVRFALSYAALQILISFLLVRFFKVAIGKPRPGHEGLHQPGSFSSQNNAFPSGHTTEISSAAGAMALHYKSILLTVAMSAIIALVAFSRIYLGKHHGDDVFFGWALGSATAWGINVVADFYNKKYQG